MSDEITPSEAPQVLESLLQEVREASFGELDQGDLRQALRKALKAKICAEKGCSEEHKDSEYAHYCYVNEVFQTFIVSAEDDEHYRTQYFKRPYTVSGADVTVGDRQMQVELAWVPALVKAREAAVSPEVETAVQEAREADENRVIETAQLGETSEAATALELPVQTLRESVLGTFREADFNESGVITGIIPISPGTSINRAHYAREVVQRDLNVFNGLPVFYDHQDPAQPKPLKNAIGVLENARWDETNDVPLCDLRYPPSKESVITEIKELHALYGPDKVGFSIDMPVKARVARMDGKVVRVVEALIGGGSSSVDVVWRPSAGGGFGNALEAAQGTQELEMLDGMSVEDILAARPDVKQALEAVRSEPAKEEPAPAVNTLTREAVQDDIKAAIAAAKREGEFSAKVAGLKLPERVKQTILREAADAQYEEQACESILTEWANLSAAQSGGVQVQVPGGSVQVTESIDKAKAALLGAALNEDQVVDGKRVPRFHSFSQAILAFHPELAGLSMRNPQQFAMESVAKLHWGGGSVSDAEARESITSTSFNLAWADVMHKVLEGEIANPDRNKWRKLVSDFKALKDFDNTFKVIRVGGYNNVPTVAEGAPYTSATTPTQEKVELGIDKYGYLEDFTWEAALRDDLAVLARIPMKLAEAWVNTQHDVVFSLLTDNSGAGANLDYDSTALYHTDHANILASAFSVANLITMDGKMRDQTDVSNGKKKGYRGRYLLYADAASLRASVWEALSSTYKVTSSAAEINLPNFVREVLGYEAIEVEYPDGSDTRYELVADPSRFPTITVGYLNGQETPDLFIQDMERVGTVFNADKITYKLRGSFGAKLLNHRSFQRGQI